MGFWRWMANLAGLPDGPARTFSSETVWSPAGGPVDWHVTALGSGLKITRSVALSVPTVLRGRNMLCSVSTLPLQLRDSGNAIQTHPMFDGPKGQPGQFDPNVPNIAHLAMTVEDLVFDAVAWWRVTGRTFDGYPSSVERLEPGRVTIDPPATNRQPNILPSGLKSNGATVKVDGLPASFRDLIRFDSPNPAVLEAGRRAIQRALLLDAAARMYADDPQAKEFFTAADGIDPDEEEEIEEFLASWRDARKSRSTAYVPSKYEYHQSSVISPAEMQLSELQKSAGLDIANALGIDPEDLGISTTSRTYANAVDRRRDRINDVLAPYMRAITDRLSMGDVTKRGYYVAFNLDDYMKANPTERWANYKTAQEIGVMDAPEIRETEGLPPAASTPAGGETGGTVTALPTDGAVAASRRRAHSFGDAPSEHTFTFDTSAGHTFSVDQESRTITGLALPYGAVAHQYWGKVRFRKGALQYSEVSRVKHFMDHYRPVGKALDIKDSDGGLTVKLSVAKGQTGDELLGLAADGVYDGLSVGVDFSVNPEDGDVELADDGVYEVVRADLREVSTTAMPAFDDARVTKVAASRTGRNTTMKCATCGTDHAPNVACPTTPPAVTPPAKDGEFSAEERQRFHDLAKLFGMDVTLPEEKPNGPSTVDPTTFGRPTTKVNEAAPYRFDRKGNLTTGTHEFSTDLFALKKGDVAATDRVTEFVKAQFAIATGDVNELNPTTNRPDMYVDQREYRYPIWDSINKGTLANITPFFFPKFSSASGLVGNHTEGVEPTPGTFVTTNQTVTPTAISGKAEINREVWDQGGSPAVSNLIWRKMLQGWYEALEAFAVSILDAASPTQITLTTAAADDALVDELTEALALLQFVRGGFSMDNAFTQVDLYKALVAAKATDGRKLLPALSPANADGTARTRWQGLDVNGTAFLPAWALAATGTVAASSYLFDSESVWGWASAPQRIDIEYQVKSRSSHAMRPVFASKQWAMPESLTTRHQSPSAMGEGT
jgi:HK97 family phage prohead protease